MFVLYCFLPLCLLVGAEFSNDGKIEKLEHIVHQFQQDIAGFQHDLDEQRKMFQAQLAEQREMFQVKLHELEKELSASSKFHM